jgi:hypothetical protein
MRHEYTLTNARRLTNELQDRFDRLAILVRDREGGSCALTRMLAAGQFPATEANDLRSKLDALEDAIADLTMSLIIPLESADEN